MTINSFLADRALECLDSPFSVVVPERDDRSSSVLTFRKALKAVKFHEELLDHCIQDLVGEIHASDDVAIAYLSMNTVDMFLSMLASTSKRFQPAKVTLLNTRWTPEEISEALRSLEQNAKTIILYGPGFDLVARKVVSILSHRACCSPLPQVAEDFVSQSCVQLKSGISGKTSLDRADKMIDKQIRTVAMSDEGQRDAFIIYTSGTTGGSKGVRLSHRAIIVQALSKLKDPCKYSDETTLLASTVPLFHVGGLSSILATVFAGGCLIFPETQSLGFDAGFFRRSLSYSLVKVNTLAVVPAMMVTFFAMHGISVNYPAVRLILIGGQSASKDMLKCIKTVFPEARIVQTYACTEAASSLTFLHLNQVNDNPLPLYGETSVAHPKGDCIGLPPSHITLRIFQEGDVLRDVTNDPYTTGIIATKGPHLMSGYWKRGTQDVDHSKEWYCSNDLGFCDEKGQFYFYGRVNDAIRTGGETVIAQEVERILLQHPTVSECAVFPRKDDRFGEAVACAIVLEKGASIPFSALKRWCQDRGLASYKRPRYFFLVDELPRNSSGKVLKRELAKMVEQTRSRL